MKNRKYIMFIFLVLFANIFLASLISLANGVAQVTILSYSDYVDSLGWYTIVGEVQNNGDMHLEYVRITATFHDSVNNVVGVGTGYAKSIVLLHGRKSPFEIRLTDTNQSAKVDHYSLTTSYEISEFGKPEGLEILSISSYIDSFGWMHVSGEIKNIGGCATRYVKVIATFYDNAGRVVSCDSTYSEPHHLEVNQIGSFNFLHARAVSLIQSYQMTAESYEYTMIPEFSTLIAMALAIGITILLTLLHTKKLNTHSMKD